ncbi:MAG: thioredoxin family protein [Cellvibrio sp.]
MLVSRVSRPAVLSSIALILFAVIFLSAAVALADENIEADHVRIRWLAPEQFGENPAEKTIGLYFEVDEEWHVYWRNAGDSGAAPRFAFTSEQLAVGEPLWPYPERLPIAHLTNIGYEGNVAYLFPARLTDKAGERVTLKADLEWLVCKEECIPGFATLTLDRLIGGDSDQWSAQDADILAHFQARLPQASDNSPWRVGSLEFDETAAQLILTLQGPAGLEPTAYPLDGNFVSAAAPEVTETAQGYQLRFNTARGVAAPDKTDFVVVADGAAWAFSNITLSAPATFAAPETQSLLVLLLLAFAGGIILNLMPCVFPVLSIKLFSLIQASGQGAAAHRVREGVMYTAGVLMTFALLGGVFLVLRAGGAAIGWGFQLQSPWVVVGLAVLFWVMALSFIGAFEFGHSLMNLAGRANSRSSFATGVLAVFVAAPCTGPFMGAALGASATLPALPAMAIFLGLGAGLAAPFLLLAVSPGLSALLPRPGPWMETLRQFLAFPLFATVIWLLWVLSRLVGDDGWLIGASLLLLIALAIWLVRSERRWVRAGAWALGLVAILVSVQRLQTLEAPVTATASASAWQPFDTQQIAAAQQKGQAVFIDYTAAWCITCQVNKKLVLDTDEANALFEQHDVLRIRADWTRYDENITQALAALNRNSVPVYVFYPAGGGREILPQILTMDSIRELFNEFSVEPQ